MKEIRRGDIYYADLNPVIGSEQGGLRPVLVIQNDVGNKFSPTTIVAAITSKQDKAEIPTHAKIKVKGLSRTSLVLLEQIRTIDKARMRTYINTLDEKAMKQINGALTISVGLESNIEWEA